MVVDALDGQCRMRGARPQERASVRKNLNGRPFQKLPGCRASAFAQPDAPALQPLPAQLWELARFRTVT
jgi:hypothetical protein